MVGFCIAPVVNLPEALRTLARAWDRVAEAPVLLKASEARQCHSRTVYHTCHPPPAFPTRLRSAWRRSSPWTRSSSCSGRWRGHIARNAVAGCDRDGAEPAAVSPGDRADVWPAVHLAHGARQADLSFAQPFFSLSRITVCLASVYFLHEQIAPEQIAGSRWSAPARGASAGRRAIPPGTRARRHDADGGGNPARRGVFADRRHSARNLFQEVAAAAATAGVSGCCWAFRCSLFR